MGIRDALSLKRTKTERKRGHTIHDTIDADTQETRR